MSSHSYDAARRAVDIVAMALYERRTGRHGGWESMPSFVQDNYRADARAAMAAVRVVLLEPTDEMIKAANGATPSTTVVMLRSSIKASPIAEEALEQSPQLGGIV